MSRGSWFLATLVALIDVAAAAEPREIVLWPQGVPEPRLPAEPAESVEKKADGIARRTNVSNPRLVVYDIPRADGAAAVAATNQAAARSDNPSL